ncbi:MAG: L,D-transpeptidase family protein [Clostridia bacterium]|nr:L,D-transpeptidase family protein [Clostridia bacterium]
MSCRSQRSVNLMLVILLIAAVAIPAFGRTSGLPGASGGKSAAVSHSYSILIDLDENRLFLLDDGKLFKSYTCATGTKESPSPQGLYRIIKKSLWGEGFGGCWLGLDCPWGDYGIHGTTSPETVGSRASHGCFRLYSADCAELYSIVPLGTPVFITAGCYGAFGNGFRTIRPGMYGLDIQVIQKRLSELGFYHGDCNGRYDAAGFRAAVHHFQKAEGLAVSDKITRRAAEKMGFVMMD